LMQIAWELIPKQQPKAKKLLEQAAWLREQLKTQGFNTANSSTHIIPILLPSAADTLTWQRTLSERSIRVSAIRPPSVPTSQSRLRIALNTSHDEVALKELLTGLSANLT